MLIVMLEFSISFVKFACLLDGCYIIAHDTYWSWDLDPTG